MAKSTRAGSADDRGHDESRCGSASERSGAEALESALVQLGHFGLYQRYMLLMLCLPNLLAAMYSLNFVFVADQVPFRCLVPECEGRGEVEFNSTVVQELLGARCHRYAPLRPDEVTCLREDFHPNDTIECQNFVYENMNTVFAEFGLACREWLRTMVGSVRNAALPVALLLTGYISDRWGRRTAFCVFSGCAGTLGLVKSFSRDYRMLLAFEFLEAALGYGFNSAGYVMVVESALPSQRAAFACATGVAYGLGGMLFALIAWRLQYWRKLLRAVYAPALLLPLYWILVDESPRWLYATGRSKRAGAVLRKAAYWNMKTIDEDVMKTVESGVERSRDATGAGEGVNPWLELVKSHVLMVRFAVCSWCWVAAAFVYYGLTINSVSLSDDKYTNFALNMAMEVAASLLLMMALERLGRKKSVFFSFLLCGVACVTPHFISHKGTGLGLFFLGKLAITFAFNSMYVFTTELFPTRTRSSALAACSLVGRLGSIVAPQTPLLSMYVQATLYGASSLLAALAVLLVPETRRARLPLQLRDAEHLRAQPPAPPPPPPAPHVRVISADT